MKKKIFISLARSPNLSRCDGGPRGEGPAEDLASEA